MFENTENFYYNRRSLHLYIKKLPVTEADEKNLESDSIPCFGLLSGKTSLQLPRQ